MIKWFLLSESAKVLDLCLRLASDKGINRLIACDIKSDKTVNTNNCLDIVLRHTKRTVN